MCCAKKAHSILDDVNPTNRKVYLMSMQDPMIKAHSSLGDPQQVDAWAHHNPKNAAAHAMSYLTIWRFQDLSGAKNINAVGDLLLRLMYFCDRTPEYGDFAMHLARAQQQ
jgi:hypothetical protein